MEKISSVTEKHNINNIEAALRWIYFHSQLKSGFGDAVILGVSKLHHLESNLEAIKKGPLPEEVVNVFEEIWTEIKPDAPAYHM